MKKLLVLLSSLCIVPLQASLLPSSSSQIGRQQGLADEGWLFSNTTGKPISLAWYKTRISSRVTREYAWGSKEKITENVELKPGEERFVMFPPSQGKWENYSTRRQLILTYDPFLLREQIAANDSGIVQDALLLKSLLITDKYSLPDEKGRQSVFLVKDDSSSAGIKIQAEQRPSMVAKVASNVIPLALQRKGKWFFENQVQKPVYYAWYEADWDPQKKAYINPEQMAGQQVTELRQGDKAMIELPPVQKPSGFQQLLVTFNKSSLSKKIVTDDQLKLPADMSSYGYDDLKPTDSQWKVLEENNRPRVVQRRNQIQVINTTNEPLYGAMYYVNDAGAIPAAGMLHTIEKIDPQMSKYIEYPAGSLNRGDDIQLFIAREAEKDLLQKDALVGDTLSKLTKKSFAKTNIINWFLEGAFIILYDAKPDNSADRFKVESVGGGGIERTAKKLFDTGPLAKDILEAFELRFKDPRYNSKYLPDKFIVDAASSNKPQVILGNQVLPEEAAFVKEREEPVRQAINKLFNKELIPNGGYVPKIALVFTGGGYRAMTETIGFLKGAEKTGIFDCSMYMTGLSGSTWAINPLVVSGVTPTEFANLQKPKVNRGDTSGDQSLYTLVQNVVKEESYAERRFIQMRYGQFHGPVGLYGHALAEVLLQGFTLNGKQSHDILLSDLAINLKGGKKYPLPISVAVDENTQKGTESRVWFEFNPYHVGTHQFGGSWVDTRLFGSFFRDGSVVHYVPEYPLAQFMGVWGSAFALSAKDIAKSNALGGLMAGAISTGYSQSARLYDLVLWKDPVPSVCTGRFTAAQIPNFNFLYKAQQSEQLRNEEFLCLIDGGIAKDETRHNFSTIPALQRNIDILIMCDSIEHPGRDLKSAHLVAAYNEAKRLGLSFPDVSQDILNKINTDVSTLIKGDSGPVVIYMKGKQYKGLGFSPDAAEASFMATLNFKYLPDQYEALSGLTEKIMSDGETVDKVKEAIELVIKKKTK